jgi:hypothetical protein
MEVSYDDYYQQKPYDFNGVNPLVVNIICEMDDENHIAYDKDGNENFIKDEELYYFPVAGDNQFVLIMNDNSGERRYKMLDSKEALAWIEENSLDPEPILRYVNLRPIKIAELLKKEKKVA